MNKLKKPKRRSGRTPLQQPTPKELSAPLKLVLHIEDEKDRKRYQRLIASAADSPQSSVPMGGRCCGNRHKKTKTNT